MRRGVSHILLPLFVFSLFAFASIDGFAQRASIELIDAKATATQTAINIVGQVKNISSSDISGVTVYCDFQNGSGKVIRSEQAALDTDPLGPNKTSEFKCSTKPNPEIKGYGFRFDRMFGGPLVVKDSRKK